LEAKVTPELKQWLIDADANDALLYLAKRDIFTLPQLKAVCACVSHHTNLPFICIID
jgi:hypothetical protein